MPGSMRSRKRYIGSLTYLQTESQSEGRKEDGKEKTEVTKVTKPTKKELTEIEQITKELAFIKLELKKFKG